MGRTRIAMVTGAALALGLAGTSQISAQTNAAIVGAGRAEVRAALDCTVPSLFRLRSVGSSTLVEQTAEYSIVEVRVEAGSNAQWRLDVIGQSGDLDVRSEVGDYYRPVGLDGALVPVVQLRAPTNATQVVVRFRIWGAPAVVRTAKAQLLLRPVSATQGAVIVTWMGSE